MLRPLQAFLSVANARFTIGLGRDNALDLVLLITFIGEQSADAGDQADIGVGRHSVGVFPGGRTKTKRPQKSSTPA